MPKRFHLAGSCRTARRKGGIIRETKAVSDDDRLGRHLGSYASQAWSAAAPPQADEPNRGFLDALREKIHRWTESLWDPARGGFRQNAAIGVNLMSTTDVASMRYAANDPDIGGGHRDAWVRSLQQAQFAEQGLSAMTRVTVGSCTATATHVADGPGPEHPWRPVAAFSAPPPRRRERPGG